MIVSIYIIPILLIIALILAIIKKKDAFSAFNKGALEGLKLCKEIIPSIIAMISLVIVIKSSGIIEDISKYLSNLFSNSKFVTDIVPMVFFRPISGSASLAILNSLCEIDPDSLECITASIIQGSTDTTFYVLALYFGTIGITKWRHSLKVGLMADVVGMSIAIVLTLIFFG